MKKLFLGVDGGGTKTKLTLIDEQKNILKISQSEGSNYQLIGLHKAKENIKQATQEVLTDLNLPIFRAYFCLSGVNFQTDQKRWQQQLSQDSFFKSLFIYPPIIVNDTQAALRAGTEDKNGVVIISGTGSNCYGKNEEGEEAKSGGEDYILSDQGSGYFVGLEMLKAVTKQLDGRGEETALKEMIFKKFEINSLEELASLVCQKPWGKTEIAQTAPLVEEAGINGDKIALEIIDKSGFELGLMVKSVVKKLKFDSNEFSLVLAGSVITNDGLISKSLKEYIKSFAQKVKFTKPNMDPSLAAAFMALEST